MSTYALIDLSTGMVTNTIVLNDPEDWTPPDGFIVVQTDEASAGWTYAGGVFSPPPIDPPTPEQVLSSQSAKLSALKSVANAQKTALTNRISELNDAVEYEVATTDEIAELPLRVAQRKLWGLHSIDLGRVTSQEGWPPDVIWPVAPTEGMDLTVSAVAPGSSQIQ